MDGRILPRNFGEAMTRSVDPLKLLQKRCNGRALSIAAKELGVSPQYLSDVLHRRRDPGPLILQAIGLERVVTYRRIRG